MGCVPPQKNNNKIPPTNVKATQRLSSGRQAALQSQKYLLNGATNNRQSKKSLPIHSRKSLSAKKQQQVLVKKYQKYQKDTFSPRAGDQHVIRVISPRKLQKESVQKAVALQGLSAISVKELSIHSTIKSSSTEKVAQGKKVLTRAGGREGSVEMAQITFNNNNFATNQSSQQSKRRNWKAELLKNELNKINEEQFKRISVQNMNFD